MMQKEFLRYCLAAGLAAVCLLPTPTSARAIDHRQVNLRYESGPIPVQVVKTDSGYQLLRGGQPYMIKGVGGDASMEMLKACGGNSIRTWGPPDQSQLDHANDLGLTMTIGIWLGHKEQGFDYTDPKQVAAQKEQVRSIVLQYRNSPGLLVWGLGNEMEGYDSGDDPNVWKAVDDIAKMVKQLDPNHPTMTVVAEVTPKKIQAFNTYCPDIDILGINTYAGCSSVAQRYRDAGGSRPFIVTEFGWMGTWEMGKAPWGAAPEFTSTVKAQWYKKAYVGSIAGNPLCLGSYAFQWGAKRESTATWYGMLLPTGQKLAPVDMMTQLWTGNAPAVTAPVVQPLSIISDIKVHPDMVQPGATIKVHLDASDPQNDPLTVKWVFEYDPASYHLGGAMEFSPPQFPQAILHSDIHGAVVKMPKYGGGYRLYAYVYDKHNEAATANIPLFVKGNVPPPPTTAYRPDLPVVVYGPGQNAPYVASGYEGNTGAISIDLLSSEAPRTTPVTLKAQYNAPDQWGGVVWQSPANNWGNDPGGLNLEGAKTLTFWARGAKGGEVVSFSYGVLGASAKYHDSASDQMPNVTLSKEWKKYTFDLRGKDLSCIMTPFVWVVAGAGQPVTFYLDDIRFQ